MDQPLTNGRAGGNLPAGKGTARSPVRSFSVAARKAAPNQVAGPDLPPDSGAGGMDQRSGGALGARGTVVGMLAPDGRRQARWLMISFTLERASTSSGPTLSQSKCSP